MDEMLNNLKLLLGIQAEDTALDEKLMLILNASRSRLKLLLGGLDPPEELEYIILDVSAIRFNKLGSEGLSAHSVEGESLSFSSNDFAGYTDDIQAYLDSLEDNETTKGRVRFL